MTPEIGAPTAAPGMEGAIAGAGGNGAAFMVVRNTGSSADRLLSAASDAAEAVELHTMVKEGDLMKMRQVEAVEVPANGEVALAPGGYHVMMIGLRPAFQPGQTISLTLRFERAGEVTLPVEVRQP